MCAVALTEHMQQFDTRFFLTEIDVKKQNVKCLVLGRVQCAFDPVSHHDVERRLQQMLKQELRLGIVFDSQNGGGRMGHGTIRELNSGVVETGDSFKIRQSDHFLKGKQVMRAWTILVFGT
jgi:hypothetical protein